MSRILGLLLVLAVVECRHLPFGPALAPHLDHRYHDNHPNDGGNHVNGNHGNDEDSSPMDSLPHRRDLEIDILLKNVIVDPSMDHLRRNADMVADAIKNVPDVVKINIDPSKFHYEETDSTENGEQNEKVLEYEFGTTPVDDEDDDEEEEENEEDEEHYSEFLVVPDDDDDVYDDVTPAPDYVTPTPSHVMKKKYHRGEKFLERKYSRKLMKKKFHHMKRRKFANKAGPRKAGPRQDGPRKAGPRQDGPRQHGPRQDGPRQAGPRQDGPRQDGPRQYRVHHMAKRGRGDE